MFAKVLLPLALGKEFDYSVQNKVGVLPGARVLVNFRGTKKVGVISSISEQSDIKNIKPILDVLDEQPIISAERLAFARLLAARYPYPLSEFVFRMVPKYLKTPKKVKGRYYQDNEPRVSGKQDFFFYRADRFSVRYAAWREKIKKALSGGSVLVCVPQEAFVDELKSFLEEDFPGKVHLIHSSMGDKSFFSEWIKSRKNSILIGLRASIFLYPEDLNLIVVEDEPNRHYSQEEKPYYNLCDIAYALAKFKNIGYVMGGICPSIKTYSKIKRGKVLLEDLSEPENNVRVLDTSVNAKAHIITVPFKELLNESVNNGVKALVLFNRTGYDRVIACTVCGTKFFCERCSTGLTIALNHNEGVCPYCGFKKAIPRMCPKCRTGYIKSYGMGVVRAVKILKEIFPDANIAEWENHNLETDICMATTKLFSEIYEHTFEGDGFYLDIDRELSRINYDATVQTYIMIKKLAAFVSGKLNIFTSNDAHYLFKMINAQWTEFYDFELKQRETFNLPPYSKVAKIVIRGKDNNSLSKVADTLYNRLNETGLEVYGPMREIPFMLRGNYRYSFIIKSLTVDMRGVIEKEMSYARKKRVKVAAVIE